MSKVVYWYVWHLNWTDNESDFSQIEKKNPDYWWIIEIRLILDICSDVNSVKLWKESLSGN